MCANSEGSVETARMRSLDWAFAVRLCDKYHFLTSWLFWCYLIRHSNNLKYLLLTFDNLSQILHELHEWSFFTIYEHLGNFHSREAPNRIPSASCCVRANPSANPSITSPVLMVSPPRPVFRSHYTHFARRYMSNGWYLSKSFCEIASALIKFWLVESWFWIQGPVAADTSHSGTMFDQSDARRHSVSWILIGRK